MPRRSKPELNVVRPTLEPWATRLRVPGNLDPDTAERFRKLVASVGPGHFRAGDEALVLRHVELTQLAEAAAAALRENGRVWPGGAPSPWVGIQLRTARTLATLAVRLRLSPQSRLRGRSLTKPGRPPSAYETMDLDNDDDK